MYPRRSQKLTGQCIVFTASVLVVFVQTLGQTGERPVIGQGEVTGNDVYVRSGDSLNHYTVCKVNAGDRVTVVGERGEWYEILPPEGTFSLISGDYVDAADEKAGVVNGDNVRVRAGSVLNENKYTVQTMLSKGAQVTILGRNPDGFLRIKPPTGATLWISRQFVEIVPAAQARPEGATATVPGSAEGEAESGQAQPSENAADASAAARDETDRSMLAALDPTQQRRELQKIDAAAAEELAKPLLERRFDPLIERYQVVAAQQEDQFAERYALARIERLSHMADTIGTVLKLRELNDETQTKRRDFLEGRAKIRDVMPPVPSALDAQGELRASALYPARAFPERYRLVDTTGGQVRTVGYVEIPKDSLIKVDDFLGRYVGVRASAKRLQTGGVNPVPIYVASELVLLQPAVSATNAPEEK